MKTLDIGLNIIKLDTNLWVGYRLNEAPSFGSQRLNPQSAHPERIEPRCFFMPIARVLHTITSAMLGSVDINRARQNFTIFEPRSVLIGDYTNSGYVTLGHYLNDEQSHQMELVTVKGNGLEWLRSLMGKCC